MIIYYRGKEQLNGYLQTKQIFQGGYIAKVLPNSEEYVDWSSFDWVRTIEDGYEDFLIANFGKAKIEFWQSANGDTTTTKRPKIDENGVAWEKIKREFTPEETQRQLNFEKTVLEGILVSIFQTKYAQKNLYTVNFEQYTFHIQEQEAKEYLATGSAGTLISKLADLRGISVAQLADKIVKRSEEFKLSYGELLGSFQKYRSTIWDFDNLTDLRQWRKDHLGWNIPTILPPDQYVPEFNPLTKYQKNI